MANIWPTTKMIWHDYGLSNYRKPVYCVMNPNQVTYALFKSIVGSNDNINKYYVSFKVEVDVDEHGVPTYEYYDNQIVAWYSKYLGPKLVADIIKTYTKAEDDEFQMVEIN